MATLVALTLAACGNENNKKSSSSETKTTQKSNVSKESKKTEHAYCGIGEIRKIISQRTLRRYETESCSGKGICYKPGNFTDG